LTWAAWLTGSAACSGNTVQDTPSSAGEGSSAGTNSGAAARLVVKRPTILVTCVPSPWLSRPREFQLLADAGVCSGCRLGGRLRQNQSLELRRDLVAGLDLVERNAAIDGFAHQAVMVGDAGRERITQDLLDVALAQAGGEHLLLEAIDDHLRL